jgi:8-oxo-dGTP diphosphatase
MEVACALVYRQQKLLICKRSAHKQHGGLWELPGGKLEQGETLIHCIQRELLEELQVRVLPVSVQPFVATGKIRLHPLLCLLPASAKIQLQEHEAMQWVTPTGALQFQLAPADKLLLTRIAANT